MLLVWLVRNLRMVFRMTEGRRLRLAWQRQRDKPIAHRPDQGCDTGGKREETNEAFHGAILEDREELGWIRLEGAVFGL